jgi:hypothetical protein
MPPLQSVSDDDSDDDDLDDANDMAAPVPMPDETANIYRDRVTQVTIHQVNEWMKEGPRILWVSGVGKYHFQAFLVGGSQLEYRRCRKDCSGVRVHRWS